MKKYRIKESIRKWGGSQFRIQKRILFFFWRNFDDQVHDRLVNAQDAFHKIANQEVSVKCHYKNDDMTFSVR